MISPAFWPACPAHGMQEGSEPHTAKTEATEALADPQRPLRARVAPTVCGWLESDPDATGKDLFERLQGKYPSVFPDGQLRTLQRRLKEWRNRMAHRLAFGVTSTMTTELIAVPLQRSAIGSERRSVSQPSEHKQAKSGNITVTF